MGAAAGYIASRYSLGPHGHIRWYLAHADVFAHWSTFLITADAATDVKAVCRASTSELLYHSFGRMLSPFTSILPHNSLSRIGNRYSEVFGKPYQIDNSSPPYPRSREYELENYAVESAFQIGTALNELWLRYSQRGLQEEISTALTSFYLQTLDLMAGQLQSLDQTIVDDDHDWGWYRHILDRKSLNVLLALLSLLVSPVASNDPTGALKKAFFVINRAFFHRQVLDDLLDFEEDLLSGTANSLIYMLVTQGRIAQAFLNRDAVNEEEALPHELKRSGLVPYANLDPIPPRVPAETNSADNDAIAKLVTFALANRAADRRCTIGSLAQTCLSRKTSLVQAWSTQDRAEVRKIVRGSGIAERILSSISGRSNQDEIESALQELGDDGVNEVMNIFYERTLRTYEKCRRLWEPA